MPEKIVLAKEMGVYYFTVESNYDSPIQDAFDIHRLRDCNNAKEAYDTIIRYGIAAPDEIINLTGEEI